MRFISESILDDVEVQDSNSAQKLAAHQSQLFSEDVHPGEYSYAVLIEWASSNRVYANDWVEDVLRIYASRYNICLIRTQDDVRRLQQKVHFKKYIPKSENYNGEIYAIIEFDIPNNNYHKNLMTVMLYLLGTGDCMLYNKNTLSWQNTFYTEKTSSNSSVAMYVHNLFNGVLTNSQYKETV
jgi:hypothetical protein